MGIFFAAECQLKTDNTPEGNFPSGVLQSTANDAILLPVVIRLVRFANAHKAVKAAKLQILRKEKMYETHSTATVAVE